MAFEMLWWYWIIIGVVLLLIEMMSGTFVLFWMGSSALVTGVVVWWLQIGFVMQVLLWAALSVGIMIVWYQWWRSPPEDISIGQAHHNLTVAGTVTEEIVDHARGRVRFDTPVSGASSWAATSSMGIAVGERVKIRKIKGQLIIVDKIN